MKILNAIIKNYKAIHRIEITPKGTITVISGNNSQGKSSAIEALVTTLAGKEHGKGAPVRTGSDGAIIEIDLGDRMVKRTIKGGKDELEVSTKEGHVVKRPRSGLDELMDKRKFDVMSFITGKPKEQRALLMELAGLSFDQLDQTKNVVYNNRTSVGRERDLLKGQLNGYIKHNDAPEKLVDTQEILEEIKKANNHNSDIRGSVMEITNSEDRLLRLGNEIEQVNQELERLDEKREQLASNYEKAHKFNNNLKEKTKDLKEIDTTDLEKQLDGAEGSNDSFRAAQKRNEVLGELEEKQKEYDGKTGEIEKMEEDKIKQLKEAKFPIEGLSLTDEGVIYNNLPLEDESRSNKLKVALAIAMSLPTELKVIILDDAEVLDDDNMKIVDEMMAANNYQAIIARRQDPDENTYTIKEGLVV